MNKNGYVKPNKGGISTYEILDYLSELEKGDYIKVPFLVKENTVIKVEHRVPKDACIKGIYPSIIDTTLGQYRHIDVYRLNVLGEIDD